MKYFISAGEPSGDLHGATLARELIGRDPQAELYGFGGPRLAAAGCRLLYPLTDLAFMWFGEVLTHLHLFLRLLAQADRFLARHRPDAVILIDFPGFNWWIARRAHARGIPVYYFVPPQIWAWLTWRVRKMRWWVDHVFCCLPFEKEWYDRHGVAATYVGHPFFDDLAQRRLDEPFCRQLRALTPGPLVGLLPGSRTQEVKRNFPTMLAAARRLAAHQPHTRFPVACFRKSHRRLVLTLAAQAGLSVDAFVGRTPEIIRTADVLIAVSGSVGLEILYYTTPAVILYRVPAIGLRLSRFFRKCPYISLVNLLAGQELLPEFLTAQDVSPPIADLLRRYLDDPLARQAVVRRLAELKARVAQPGAAARAAKAIIARTTARSGRPPRHYVSGRTC